MPSRSSALLVDRLAWESPSEPLSFAIHPGERVFICGTDAAGVLRAIGGFQRRVSGRIVCDGRDISGVPTPQRHLAYIPPSDSLVDRISILGNITLAGASRAAALAALDRLGQLQIADRHAATLTQGQRRLAVLARALAASPALLLVEQAPDDSPAIPDALRRLATPAALVATEDATLALARADRILLLRDGRAVQFASPNDLYERPTDRDAAIWAGPCNLLPAMLAGFGDAPGSLRACIGQTAMEARYRDQAEGPAHLAVRPHHVRIATAGLPATVVCLDYLGAMTRVTVQTAENRMILDVADHGGLEPGTEIHVAWDWADAWPVP